MGKMKKEEKNFKIILISVFPVAVLATPALYFLGSLRLTNYHALVTIFSLLWYAIILIFYIEIGVDTAYKRLSNLYSLLSEVEGDEKIRPLILRAIDSQNLLIRMYTTTRRYTIWVPFLSYIGIFFLLALSAVFPIIMEYGAGVWLSLILYTYVPVLVIFYKGMKLRPYASYERVRAKAYEMLEEGKDYLRYLV
ncbi:MAG: hypothetical protein DRN20_02100 [Thermoplasmata archaeon]|nr:MAG: hypothetical protein DRN20_02100 [Thermoplasmata archaeon]